MLKLTEGGFYSTAHEKILDEMSRLARSGERVCLIVPEQRTVVSEAEITDLLSGADPTLFEATNFTRFANTAFRMLGGISGEYSDRTTRALIMWRTLTELSPFLSMTEGRRDISAGTVDAALRAVADMQSLSIGPEELTELLERAGGSLDSRLLSKINDLTSIISLYRELLLKRYCDAGDDISTLCEKLKDNPDCFSGTHFFIEGFTSFTEPQYTLISILMARGDVTVHIPCPKEAEDAFEYTEVRETKERLLTLANKAEVKKTVSYVRDKREGVTPLLMECPDLLFRTVGKIPEDIIQNSRPDALRLFRASTAYLECDFVAADIKRRVMEGASYRDFAIIGRDGDSYFGIIDTALKKAGIPSFTSKVKSPSATEAVKLIFSAIGAVKSSFSRNDVLTYAKCGFSGVSRDACDEFELYTEVWQINKSAFLTEDDWGMSPKGLTATRTESDLLKLSRINEARRTILSPLIAYAEDQREAKTVSEHAAALFELLRKIDLEGKLYEKRRELLSLGEISAAEDAKRIWQVICDALDTVVFTLGDCEIDLGGFEMQLDVVFSSMQFGRIPLFYDTVMIGSADTLRLSERAHVYMIGVNQGAFPKSFKDSAYFSDKDKERLSGFGINVSPDKERGYARELFAFIRAFATATETVTLTSPDRSASFEESQLSELFQRIKDITGGAVGERYIDELPFSDRAYSAEAMINEAQLLSPSAKETVFAALTESGYSGTVKIAEADIKNRALSLGAEVKGLIYKGDIRSSQSKLDKYVSCPFSYFLRYDLGIEEGERAEFNKRNIGNFIHSVLEVALSEMKEKKAQGESLSEEDKRDICTRAAKSYLDSIYDGTIRRSERSEILIERLTGSAMPLINNLDEEFQNCAYTPEFFELHIGGPEEISPEHAEFKLLGGGRVMVSGFVDRVDTYKKDGKVYVRVIDYKTGTKSFSPEDLEEGKNLQMFLYLKAIVNSRNESFLREIGANDTSELVPAGVIYNLTSVGDVYIDREGPDEAEEIRKNQGRQGMLLDDPDSISAMSPTHIPVKYTKSGAPTAASKKYLYTEEGWEEISDKISKKISEIGEKMRSGDISLTEEKKNSPCAYCKYRPVCRDPRD